MISEKETITGKVNSKSSIVGELNNAVKYVDPITQEKEVTPTKEIQVVEPDKGYTGLSKVTVKPYTPIVDKKTITSNGTYKASDDNLDGYSEVEVATNGIDINEYYNLAKKTTGDCRYYIKKLPLIDTSDYTNFTSFFEGMRGLEEIPSIDTSKGTNFYRFMYMCRVLNKIPLLNFAKAISVSSMFNMGGMYIKIEEIGGFQNLGMEYSITKVANNNDYTLNMENIETSQESLMNVINNLYDIKTKGVKTQKLILGTTNLAKLTEEEIAIGTGKGWTIS